MYLIRFVAKTYQLHADLKRIGTAALFILIVNRNINASTCIPNTCIHKIFMYSHICFNWPSSKYGRTVAKGHHLRCNTITFYTSDQFMGWHNYNFERRLSIQIFIVITLYIFLHFYCSIWKKHNNMKTININNIIYIHYESKYC